MLTNIVQSDKIPGLFRATIERFGVEEGRGGFQTSYLQSEMRRLVRPDFTIVQANYVYNEELVLRGMHGEDWDKFVYIIFGDKVEVVYLDSRDQESFGAVEHFMLEPHQGVFVPAGVMNSYHVLMTDKTKQFVEAGVPAAIYGYNTTEEWVKRDDYPMVTPLDPLIKPLWAGDESEWIMKPDDRNHKTLQDLYPDRWERRLGGQS